MILVDYHCRHCDGTSEHLLPNPVPATMTCPACRSTAQRRFAPVGLAGRASAPAAPPPDGAGRALCRDNPDVPGLCHMTPDAARSWVARARGDNRTLDRELERQERQVRERSGSPIEPVAHDHGHSNTGAPTHTHGPAAVSAPMPGARL